MSSKRIPFYRDKERYTLFYDLVDNKLYKLPHRKKSNMMYMVFFIAVLYGSQFANETYQPFKGLFMDIILFLLVLGLGFVIFNKNYTDYYDQTSCREVYFDKANIKRYAMEGLKQFKTEVYGVIFMSILAIFCSVLFFHFQQLEPLIIAGMAGGITLVFISKKPFLRRKTIGEFINEEIEL